MSASDSEGPTIGHLTYVDPGRIPQAVALRNLTPEFSGVTATSTGLAELKVTSNQKLRDLSEDSIDSIPTNARIVR